MLGAHVVAPLAVGVFLCRVPGVPFCTVGAVRNPRHFGALCSKYSPRNEQLRGKRQRVSLLNPLKSFATHRTDKLLLVPCGAGHDKTGGAHA